MINVVLLIDYFVIFLFSIGLVDLQPKGDWYTWANRRKEEVVVWERIDRALCNPD